jgi:hypothetical protein
MIPRGLDMTDNVENRVLEHLRALRAGQDRIEIGLKEVKQRLTGVESGIAGLRRDNLGTHSRRCLSSANSD